MFTVQILHNLLRWAVLLTGLWTVINAITGVLHKRAFTGSDNKSNLFFMISCDIQLLLGLLLFFGNHWSAQFSNMAVAMKDKNLRFFTVEHTVVMLLAWVLVHVGRAQVKKASTDAAKHKKMLVFFGLALFLILISIPWPFREIIGRPWFRFS